MITDTEDQTFTVTEAGMRAVLETMTTMNYAITHLSRQVEAVTEATAILHARLEEMEGTGRHTFEIET